MTGPAGRVVCVGGATVDRVYRLTGPLVAGTSNPVLGRRGFGGVARNVAEFLAQLGAEVALVSRVGDDQNGRALVAALAAAGIDARAVALLTEASTAEYAAVLTPEGELALGLADMAILERLTPDILARDADLIGGADWIFADCNLPAASLAWLARCGPGGSAARLAVDAVSVAKADRLPRCLAGVDLLFLNRDEAAALVGTGPPADAAKALVARNAGAVVLTLGPEGALAASPGGLVAIPPVPAQVVDVTGAGDSLIAATLVGLLAGRTLPDAVSLGCEAAARTLGRLG